MKFIKKFPTEPGVLHLKKFVKRTLKNSSETTSKNSSCLSRGVLGVKVLENCRIEYYQLESVRKFFLPYTKKITKIWFKGNFSEPLTKKPVGARMGKGKGKLNKWCALYKRGEVVLELEYLQNELQLKKMLYLMRFKLPFRYCLKFNSKVKKNGF